MLLNKISFYGNNWNTWPRIFPVLVATVIDPELHDDGTEIVFP